MPAGHAALASGQTTVARAAEAKSRPPFSWLSINRPPLTPASASSNWRSSFGPTA